MGNFSSRRKEGPTSCKIIEGGGMCGVKNMNEIITNRHEINLSKTNMHPRGTFTKESTKYFNDDEISLFHFSQHDNIAGVRYLTIKGVNINILDEDRTSPLHLCCRTGTLQLVEEIINQGAMINLTDIMGWSPLHIACHQKRADVVLLLLKHGGNLNTKNRDGMHPADLVDDDKSCIEIINNFIHHSWVRYSERSKDMKSPFKSEKTSIKSSKTLNRNQTTDFYYNEEEEFKRRESYVKNKKILDKYKVIPKKHIFYENFKNGILNCPNYENFRKSDLTRSKTNYIINERNANDTKTVDGNNVRVKENLNPNYYRHKNRKYTPNSTQIHNFIKIPKIFATSENKMTVLNSPKKINYETSLSPFERIKQIPLPNFDLDSEKYKIYDMETHNSDDNDDSFLVDESILIQDNIKRNKAKYKKTKNKSLMYEPKEYLKENTISEENLDDSNIEDSVIFSEQYAYVESNLDETKVPIDLQNQKKIFLNENSDFFLKQVNLSEICFHSDFDRDKIQHMICFIYELDPKFSLLLFLNIFKSENNLDNFLKLCPILDKRLLGYILSSDYQDQEIKSRLIINYYDVFTSLSDFSKLKFAQSLKKILKNIVIDKNLRSIEKLAKDISQVLYDKLSQDTRENFSSHHSLFQFTFSFILVHLQLQEENPIISSKIYYDLMVILKNSNDGKNYDISFTKECFNFIQTLGLGLEFHLTESPIFNKIILIKRNKHKSYSYIYNHAYKILLLMNNFQINKLLILKETYNNTFNPLDLSLTINSKRNLLILKNKSSHIRVGEYNNLVLKFENQENFNQMKTNLELGMGR